MKKDLYQFAKSKTAVLEIIFDEDCQSPREWDNLGTMVCWHRRYNLGDKHDYSTPEDFLQELASELFGYEDVGFIQEKANAHMTHYSIKEELDIDEVEEFNVYEDDELYDTFYTMKESEAEIEKIRENYIDEIYEEMSNQELLELINTKAVILPLYLYDHSGITMNTTGFSCPWDSGQVGWIYCTHDRFKKETGYLESELFNTDIHRIPIVKEHCKVKGYESMSYFGQITSIENGLVTVDFDYNKSLEYRKAENKVTVPMEDIIEVMSNMAVEMLVGEVETYDDYIRGNVFGYKLLTLDENVVNEYLNDHNVEFEDLDIDELEELSEDEDSCWGFIGSDVNKNGIADNIGKDYLYLVKELQYAW